MMCGIGRETTSALVPSATQEGLDRSVHQVQRPPSLLEFFHVESDSIELISICEPR
jgi:hypothetical protein